ncbi:MBL fold metallo-hydrolase [Nocardiopsis ansamitocini]|uniref:MBL fold metallo-hydrolase n=1 Tax=Nocardiopsis ansamitocini TaxID=1670832 RepID=UPI002554B080|nr:MBL fold metallo-hydrolase [Nocardiopsis ansamitocini]
MTEGTEQKSSSVEPAAEGGVDAVEKDVPTSEGAEETAPGTGADEEAAVQPAAEHADGKGVQRLQTAGILDVDGEEHSVVTNTWILQADDEGVIVIDPAEDAKAILEAVGDREIYLVACTNGYRPHIGGAIEVAERDDAPIALHPRELRNWRRMHGAEHRPDIEAEGGGRLAIGDFEMEILATPGTSPGSLSYYFPELGVVCSGDSLLKGELGTVGEGYIDYTTQLASVGEELLALPSDTRVLPARGEETTVAAESKNFDSWVTGE